MTMLARLGLRSKEVASLTLDDVDWRNGEILVVGKGNRHDRLPLPVDVGEALADYCHQARPGSSCRAVFLHIRAPYAALSGSSICEIVKRACDQAGLPPIGAHRLRHSAATAMRRAGAPLLEIGQVLRRRRPKTTAHYARDDHDVLAEIARQWPGGGAL
jgi:integrase